MQQEISKHLHDIKESITSIYEYLGDNRNFQLFRKNKLLKRGIERELEIIGEATNRILKVDKNIEITHARRIVDLRNWIIHAYDNVDDVILWGIISKDLPLLKEEIEKLTEWLRPRATKYFELYIPEILHC